MSIKFFFQVKQLNWLKTTHINHPDRMKFYNSLFFYFIVQLLLDRIHIISQNVEFVPMFKNPIKQKQNQVKDFLSSACEIINCFQCDIIRYGVVCEYMSVKTPNVCFSNDKITLIIVNFFLLPRQKQRLKNNFKIETK